MKVRETQPGQLLAAEETLARLYSGNVYVKLRKDQRTRSGMIVRLAVKDSRGPGSRKSREGRRIASACWHAFGHYLGALGDAVVTVPGYHGPASGHGWRDRNIGSQYEPFMYSEACDCEE